MGHVLEYERAGHHYHSHSCKQCGGIIEFEGKLEECVHIVDDGDEFEECRDHHELYTGGIVP